MPPLTISVHQLRRRWKPAKERLNAAERDNSTVIRLHRAFSWLRQAEQIEGDDALDFALMCLWTAFNALYGQWDDRAREPVGDRECWRNFVDRILGLDVGGHVGNVLTEHRDLVMALLDDEYLSRYFWEEPSSKRAGQSKKAKYDARTWYFEKKWALILDRVIERIYLLRCQLVHGAATYGGQLNREALTRCTTMLGHLLPAVSVVLIDHGADEDWGQMCYPPMGGTPPS